MNKSKTGLFILCLLPLAFLIGRFLTDNLGVNPVETINRYLGDWALRFLIITLAITPLRIVFKLNRLMQYRRMLGLFSYFYVMLHLSSYLIIDQGLYWPEIIEDIYKRPFITIGMIVVLLLTPLAITSTNKMIKRLGGKRWQRLHRLVYPAAILAVVHFWMMVKADITEPLIYAVILFVLLILRLPAIKKYL
jgi:sulfoxide reductase heme-binding subunit YedZ